MNIQRVGDILDMLAEELPEEFYRDLNGGILLVPEAKQSPHGPDLLILGEYVVSSSMGRMIKIYYGSFQQMFSGLNEEQLTEQLREVLRHEFTHHIESLAGERGLEIKDEEQIRDYLESKRRNHQRRDRRR